MRARIMTLIFFSLVFLLIDFYLFQAVLNVSKDLSSGWKFTARLAFWAPTVLSFLALIWWAFDDPYRYSANFRNWVITGLVATYFSKTVGILFVFVDDIQRGVRWALSLFKDTPSEKLPGEAITRS
ncbi:MAG: hypothetical protein ACOYW3_04590, partial [Bacteroidota bacterium]